jgi:integrase
MGEIIRRTKGGRFLGWYIRYVDADGKRRKRASHQPTRELARKMLVQIEARVARGQIGVPAVVCAPTLAALCQRFLLEYSRPRIKDLQKYRANAKTALGRFLPTLGKRPIDALTAQEIARARDLITRSHAPASVKLSLAFLSTALSWAIQQGVINKNPVRGVERPTPQPSADFFSEAETRAILQAVANFSRCPRKSDRMLACCALLALHTGLRKGELLGLRFCDLDFVSKRLTVARSYSKAPKGGKARHMAIPDACLPALQAWQTECPPTPDGLVFPVAKGGTWPHKAMLGLPRLLRAAGVRVPTMAWHCMRHTFASHYVMQGGNLLALQKILGHSDIKVTTVYAHLAPEFLGAEMNRLKY